MTVPVNMAVRFDVGSQAFGFDQTFVYASRFDAKPLTSLSAVKDLSIAIGENAAWSVACFMVQRMGGSTMLRDPESNAQRAKDIRIVIPKIPIPLEVWAEKLAVELLKVSFSERNFPDVCRMIAEFAFENRPDFSMKTEFSDRTMKTVSIRAIDPKEL